MKRLLTPALLGIAFEGLLVALLCLFPFGGKHEYSPIGSTIALIHWPMAQIVNLLSPAPLASSPGTTLPYLVVGLQALLWTLLFFVVASYFRRSPKKA